MGVGSGFRRSGAGTLRCKGLLLAMSITTSACGGHTEGVALGYLLRDDMPARTHQDGCIRLLMRVGTGVKVDTKAVLLRLLHQSRALVIAS